MPSFARAAAMRSASAAPSRCQYASGTSFCQNAKAGSLASGFVSSGRSIAHSFASFSTSISLIRAVPFRLHKTLPPPPKYFVC